MVILVCLLTQYISGEWSDRVSAEEFQNAIYPSVYFVLGDVFPSQSRSSVALVRKWKGSRGRAVLSPLFPRIPQGLILPTHPCLPPEELLFLLFYTVTSGRSLGSV